MTYRTVSVNAVLSDNIVEVSPSLSGNISVNAEMATLIRTTNYEEYSGVTTVTPSEEIQTLQTEDKVLLENVTVDAIPEDYVGSGIPRQSELSVSGLTVTAGAGYYEEAVSETVTPNLQSASESYTPTESTQTDTIVADFYHDGLSSVEITVGAIPADYVGSEVPRRDSLSVSGATVSGAAGYYDEAVSATVDAGSATTPATSITANPSISVGSDGLISASVSKTQSVMPTVQEGYVTTGTTGNVTVSGSNTSQLPTQAGTTITPSTSEQTAVPAGKFTTGAVKVAAMPSGTEGTPVATKGAVSGHSVSVTPSVTNSAGYISGGTHTGTGVTVSASELVSGSETKTQNGTYDVTSLAQIVINVAGGGGGGLEYETGTYTPTEDIARPTIQWANTHTEAPILVLFSDQTGAVHSATNSNFNFMYCDFYKLWGHGIPYSSSGFRYAVAYYSYRGSSTSSLSSSGTICSRNSDSTSASDTSYPRYWASPTDFHPYTNHTSRYWRSGRTYKWIAVWKPTS